jgi:hypothetical protein
MLARDDYPNAPRFVVSPNDGQSVLFDLWNDGGFDHHSRVTAHLSPINETFRKSCVETG